MGMLRRLPVWIKAGGSRADVLRAIQRLRDLLDRSVPHERSAVTFERSGPAPEGHDLFFRPPY